MSQRMLRGVQVRRDQGEETRERTRRDDAALSCASGALEHAIVIGNERRLLDEQTR